MEEKREVWPKWIAGTGGAPWPVTQFTSSLGQSRSPSANLLSLHCPLQIPLRPKHCLSHWHHRASSRAVGYPCSGTGQKLDQIQVPCAQLMAETCQFAVPGLQLAGWLQPEHIRLRQHGAFELPTLMRGMCDTSICSHSLMLSQMLLPSAAGTAEHITHPARSHPDPPQALRHHCFSTEGNLQTGFRLWHFGSKYTATQLLCCKGAALGLGPVRG